MTDTLVCTRQLKSRVGRWPGEPAALTASPRTMRMPACVAAAAGGPGEVQPGRRRSSQARPGLPRPPVA
jgi:hypothetical protein